MNWENLMMPIQAFNIISTEHSTFGTVQAYPAEERFDKSKHTL